MSYPSTTVHQHRSTSSSLTILASLKSFTKHRKKREGGQYVLDVKMSTSPLSLAILASPDISGLHSFLPIFYFYLFMKVVGTMKKIDQNPDQKFTHRLIFALIDGQTTHNWDMMTCEKKVHLGPSGAERSGHSSV